jgi:ADP-ribose pyrophosphatase YjhB (NUDIX family)
MQLDFTIAGIPTWADDWRADDLLTAIDRERMMSGQAPFEKDFRKVTPEGDDKERDVCGHCGFIDYKNPRIIGAVLATYEGKVLLCRRAIEPRRGYWTLPAGFLESHEAVEDGARREAYEEALCRPTLEQVLAVYSVPRISQVHVMFRARLEKPEFAPGPESLDVRLFEYDEIPWDEIAFPTVRRALNHWRMTAHESRFATYYETIGEPHP